MSIAVADLDPGGTALVCPTWPTRRPEVAGCQRGHCAVCDAVVAVAPSSQDVLDTMAVVILCQNCATKAARTHGVKAVVPARELAR